jgi:uncharacterized membrane protein YoaK (UPF0700 family)
MHLHSFNEHSARLTGDRRVAVLASIRAARNLGRVWSVVALLLGIGISALLSGFALWPPIVSSASVIISIVVAIGVAWAGAVLLPRPSARLLWFATPIIAGIVCAALARQWSGLGALAACMAVPLVSLVLYQADARRQPLGR